jgi:hypothetical protein
MVSPDHYRSVRLECQAIGQIRYTSGASGHRVLWYHHKLA